MLRSKKTSGGLGTRAAALALSVGLAVGLSACGSSDDAGGNDSGEDLKVGLIIKTEANPFWVTIREAAQAKADEEGIELIPLAGDFDGDTDGHAAAIENLTAQGVDAIIITPNHSTSLNPLLQQARDAGILTIVLDTETDPVDAVDSTIATDNYAGGVLLGEWAYKVLDGKEPVVGTLDGVPGQKVADDRHNGFIEGFGITDADLAVTQVTDGSQDKGQTAAENAVQAVSDVNTFFAMNEPVARGAATALSQLGNDDVNIATFDGQCQGVQDVKDGKIDATILQYPSKMSEIAIDQVIDWKATGEAPPLETDSGSSLVTDQPVDDVESITSDEALEVCWG